MAEIEPPTFNTNSTGTRCDVSESISARIWESEFISGLAA